MKKTIILKVVSVMLLSLFLHACASYGLEEQALSDKDQDTKPLEQQQNPLDAEKTQTFEASNETRKIDEESKDEPANVEEADQETAPSNQIYPTQKKETELPINKAVGGSPKLAEEIQDNTPPLTAEEAREKFDAPPNNLSSDAIEETEEVLNHTHIHDFSGVNIKLEDTGNEHLDFDIETHKRMHELKIPHQHSLHGDSVLTQERKELFKKQESEKPKRVWNLQRQL